MAEGFISVEYGVLIHAPVEVVYERWNRIEDYPSFMEGVLETERLDETRFSYKSEFGGRIFESTCEFTVRIPESRLAWRTLTGPDSSGVVTFRSVNKGTKVTLKMLYDPDGGWNDEEQVRDRLQRNLEAFRALVESNA